MKINENLLALAEKAERELVESGVFAGIEKTAFGNQMRVMDAFREHQVSESHFCPTTGYGYDDRGRDVLEEMFADVFETEDAIVRHNIISGTQALCIGLFGILRTGDRMLSVTGKPYDTLDEVIGLRGEGMGSLRDFGVKYDEIAMTSDGGIDISAMEEALRNADDIKMVYIQRSKAMRYAVPFRQRK